MTKLERLIHKATDEINSSKDALDRFTANFMTNPAYALEWSAEAFQAAGRNYAAQKVLGWIPLVRKDKPELDDDGIAALILEEVRQEVVRTAMWPTRSTSIPSNEMSIYKNAAMAEYLDR